MRRRNFKTQKKKKKKNFSKFFISFWRAFPKWIRPKLAFDVRSF